MHRIAVRHAVLLVTPLLLAIGATACERTKSENPLSPSLAGPIAGVEISQPTLVSPVSGSQIAVEDQPIKLTIQNSTSTGVRPLTYTFEIAADATFAGQTFTQTGVAPGDGRTTYQLPQSLPPDRAYYWRAKADDGANAGNFSPPTTFQVYTPVIIQPPTIMSPGDGTTTSSQRPTFILGNATRTGPAGVVTYVLEVATDAAIANRVISVELAEGGAQTSYTPPDNLAPSTRFYWRARAIDPGHSSAFTPTFSFVTAAPVVVPTPVPPPGGGAPPAANDEIDLNSVTIQVGENIKSWAVTSTVTGVTYGNNTLCIFHTKAGQWPAVPWFGDFNAPVEGNQWVFANIGGKWYGGAGEWLRPGQQCKGVPPDMGPDTFYNSAPPLVNWIPRSGEMVGFAVSAPARSGQWGPAERSNIVLFRW